MNLHFYLKFITVGAVLWGGLTACASYTGKMREMREAYSEGNYPRALELLKKSGLKNHSEDTLLWQLESAMILDRQGDFEASRKFLFDADKTADDLYTVSISKTASTFISNESAADYEGEDYEKVAIHSILAHQFIAEGKASEAAVEARKINNKLYEINQKYDPKNRNKYGEDAHARYLSALIYESRGDWDSAIIDYTKALGLYEGSFSRYAKDDVPAGVIEGLARSLAMRQRKDVLKKLMTDYSSVLNEAKVAALMTQGGVVVIHELGQIAVKNAQDFFINVGSQVVRISYPVIGQESIINNGTGVDIEKKGFIAAENTAYLDAIAADTLEDRRGRLVAKQMARLLIKGQLNYQAEKNFGPLAGLAANVITAATETADTRSWTTLPKAFYITRAQLDPGTYKIKIKTNGKINRLKTITIKRGQLLLMRGVD